MDERAKAELPGEVKTLIAETVGLLEAIDDDADLPPAVKHAARRICRRWLAVYPELGER